MGVGERSQGESVALLKKALFFWVCKWGCFLFWVVLGLRVAVGGEDGGEIARLRICLTNCRSYARHGHQKRSLQKQGFFETK